MVWQIFNHFYPLTVEETRKMAEDIGFNALIEDIKMYGEERYVAKLLQSIQLSPDADKLLSDYREIIRMTMPKRMEIWDHPDYAIYHLQTWDIGFYQIKNGVMKEFFKDELKSFMNDFKRFGDRLRPFVYSLGFLK